MFFFILETKNKVKQISQLADIKRKTSTYNRVDPQRTEYR